jgi:hypothetical protein
MENKNIKIRLLQESDIDQVNAFHNKLYNDGRTISKFKWEFLNAPAGKAIYIVAQDTDNERIVGTQSAIPILLRGNKGKVILSAKSEDTLVDPEYRGMQIFEKMYALLFEQCRKENIKYIWGFTSALKPFLKISFEVPFSHGQSLMVLDIKSSYRYLSKLNTSNSKFYKLKIFSLAILSKLLTFKTVLSLSKYNNVKVVLSDKVDSYPNDLINSIASNHNDLFAIDEDTQYLHWRINTNPYHNKVFSLDFYEKEKLIANVIFNHHKDGVWYLIQALFNDNISEKKRSRIITFSLKNLIKKEKPTLIRTWNFRTNEINRMEISLFKKSGLVFLSKGVFFVWKDLEGTGELNPYNFILSRIATQGVI